jgi:hypothetical protein
MSWKGLFQLVHDYHEFRCARWECDILYPHFYLLLNMYYSTTFLRTLHTKTQFNINQFGYDFDYFQKKIYTFYMYFPLNIIIILEKKNCNFFFLVQLYFAFEVLCFYLLQHNPILLQK